MHAPYWLLCAVLTTAVACSKQETSPQTAPLARPVKLFEVSDGSARLIRQFPALVEPAENARLTFRVPGKLNQFSIRPGQEVKQGEVLGRLDPTDFLLRVEQAKARYQLTQAQYDRVASLIETKMVSKAMYDEAKAQLQVAQADYKTAQTNLSYTQLVAPFAGMVSRTLVENHENVAAQQPILELQQKGMLDVIIQVPEDVIALVKKTADYEAKVEFDAYQGQHFHAKVKEWDTRADAATNSFKVVLSLPTPTEFNALSGMTANVIADLSAFVEAKSTAFFIPASAVFQSADKAHQVWVYNDKEGQVNLRAVSVGRLTQQGLEITKGLEAGEQIVVAGVHQLSDAQPVRPWQRERGL